MQRDYSSHYSQDQIGNSIAQNFDRIMHYLTQWGTEYGINFDEDDLRTLGYHSNKMNNNVGSSSRTRPQFGNNISVQSNTISRFPNTTPPLPVQPNVFENLESRQQPVVGSNVFQNVGSNKQQTTVGFNTTSRFPNTTLPVQPNTFQNVGSSRQQPVVGSNIFQNVGSSRQQPVVGSNTISRFRNTTLPLPLPVQPDVRGFAHNLIVEEGEEEDQGDQEDQGVGLLEKVDQTTTVYHSDEEEVEESFHGEDEDDDDDKNDFWAD
jgi:hypothetical protein